MKLCTRAQAVRAAHDERILSGVLYQVEKTLMRRERDATRGSSIGGSFIGGSSIGGRGWMVGVCSCLGAYSRRQGGGY